MTQQDSGISLPLRGVGPAPDRKNIPLAVRETSVSRYNGDPLRVSLNPSIPYYRDVPEVSGWPSIMTPMIPRDIVVNGLDRSSSLEFSSSFSLDRSSFYGLD